jgi:hypothetical protein
MVVFFNAIQREPLGEHPLGSAIQWLATGDTFLKIGVTIDPLGAVTLFPAAALAQDPPKPAGDAGGRGGKAVQVFLHLIETLARDTAGLALHEQVDHVIQKSGLIDNVRGDLLLQEALEFLKDKAVVEETDPEPEKCDVHSH